MDESELLDQSNVENLTFWAIAKILKWNNQLCKELQKTSKSFLYIFIVAWVAVFLSQHHSKLNEDTLEAFILKIGYTF